MTTDGRAYSISNLRERPEFAATVADRIWNAWWRKDGHALDFIRGLVDENFASTGRPMALVAHDNEMFLGTAHLIDSDLEARPQYAPWVAALWVDPQARKSGVGAALVEAGAKAGFAQGFGTVYLCCRPHLSAHYEKLGWSPVERDVDGLDVLSISDRRPGDRSLPPASP